MKYSKCDFYSRPKNYDDLLGTVGKNLLVTICWEKLSDPSPNYLMKNS